MMILSNNFAILDMPKTGSTFAVNRLGIINGPEYRHLRIHTDLPTYAFYRDPTSWYVSYISFIRYGSEKFTKPPSVIAQLLHERGELTVDSFLDACLGLSPDIFQDMLTRRWAQSTSEFQQLFVSWARNGNQDLYTFMCEYYFPHTILLPFGELSDQIDRLCSLYDCQPVEVPSRINVTDKLITLTSEQEQRILTVTQTTREKYEPLIQRLS